MKFITTQDVAARAAALEGLDTLEARLFGANIVYYVLLNQGLSVTGLPARIVGLRPGPDEESPFHVDLVIDTAVDVTFLLLENLFVDSISVRHRITGAVETPACCIIEDLEKVIELVNAPRFSDGLRVIK